MYTFDVTIRIAGNHQKREADLIGAWGYVFTCPTAEGRTIMADDAGTQYGYRTQDMILFATMKAYQRFHSFVYAMQKKYGKEHCRFSLRLLFGEGSKNILGMRADKLPLWEAEGFKGEISHAWTWASIANLDRKVRAMWVLDLNSDDEKWDKLNRTLKVAIKEDWAKLEPSVDLIRVAFYELGARNIRTRPVVA